MSTSSVLSTKAYAGNILAKEYYVKAAFLYNFARLIEWPTTAFPTETSPFHLCFIGKEPFDSALRSIRNKKINGRSLIIHRGIFSDHASKCQILFISQSEKNNIPHILSILNHAPVLTVSELPGFAEQQGHIRLFLSNDEKIKLEINHDAINKAGLKISSRILTLAKIVSTREPVTP